ncbi:bacteriophage holin [Candidatus Woesearchaeota archaeon]|nr:bacteriophage holin [Candidatus Woesearchaeota archaeon]
MKLNIKAFALACGATFGAYMFLLGIAAGFGWGNKVVEVLASMYVGFVPGVAGGLIGGIWGFIDGAIGGAIFAWLYNLILKKLEKK